MELQNNPEDIVAKSFVLVEDDLSQSKVLYLVKLNREEERLDYKDGYEVSKTALYNKNKVDLVCDIIAMANTEGGYILIGVSEKNNAFNITGVNEPLIEKITPESLNTLLNNYVNHPPLTKVGVFEIEGKKILAILILKSKNLLPFANDGQYQTENDKKSQTTFYNGEIFVRHSAKSEKAKYPDILRFVEEIREDERSKLALTAKGLNNIAGKLDIIIQTLGGQTSNPLEIDILSMGDIAIEDYFFNLLGDDKRSRYFIRILNNYFNYYDTILNNLKEYTSADLRMEVLNRETKSFLLRLVPIWYALLDSNDIPNATKLSDRLYSLYIKVNEIDYDRPNEERIYVLGEIIKIVYVLGALSIKKGDIDSLDSLIDRPGDLVTREHGDSFWFRYVITWLARTNNLPIPSLIYLAFDHYKDTDYIASIFDGEIELQKYMSQFDFFQCLYTLNKRMPSKNYFPSFKVYPKVYIEQFIKRYVHRRPWSEEYKIQLADNIKILNVYPENHPAFADWDLNWNDKSIIDFLNRYSTNSQ